MRKLLKFKIYSKCRKILFNCPKKLLKFRHSKWKKYKTLVQTWLFKKYFFNNSLTSIFYKKWARTKLAYKSSLVMRRDFIQLFDGSLRLKTIRDFSSFSKTSKFDNLKFLNNSLLKLEYKLDILLYRLNFFSDIFSARLCIDKGLILVNSKTVSHNYLLSKGDIISLKILKPNYKTIVDSQFRKAFYIPFVEADYYTNTIIVIKDLHELSYEDLALFNNYKTNFSETYHALYRK